MSKHETRKQYHDQLMKFAREAFENHQISQQLSERHWLIQRPYPDGHPGFDWTYAAEIIVTLSGRIVVTGDIGPMLFGHYSKPRSKPEGAIHWMGRQKEVTGYVCEKSHIGLGESTKQWEADIARDDLQCYYNECVEEHRENLHNDLTARLEDERDSDDETPIDQERLAQMLEKELAEELAEDAYAQAYLECIENAKNPDFSPTEVLRPLFENTVDGWEIAAEIGMVTKPAVYYTWAAIERLSALLLMKDGIDEQVKDE
jgi:hypothetical protein